MARLIESTLWVDFTRRKSPQALKARIQPWILDITFDADYLAIARAAPLRVTLLSRGEG